MKPLKGVPYSTPTNPRKINYLIFMYNHGSFMKPGGSSILISFSNAQNCGCLTLIIFFKCGEPVVLCSLILMLFKNLEPTVIRKIKDLWVPEKKSLKSGNYASLCFFPHKNPLYDCTWFFLGANWQNLTIENWWLSKQVFSFFLAFCWV